MRFTYQARTSSGEIQSGIIEASSRESAFNILKDHSLFIISLNEEFIPVYAKKIKLFDRVPKKEIIYFSRQLAIMFKSRVPLVEIFQTIIKQTKNTALRDIILKISEGVEGGSSLSDALSAYPSVFSSFYVNMVKAGEASGKLNEVFVYLADYLEKEGKLRSKITGAFVYPGFITVVFVIVIYVISVMVIPTLSQVLVSTENELPLLTKFVFGFSDIVRTKGWMIILGVVLFVGGIYYAFKKNEKLRNSFFTTILMTPLIGGFLKKIYLARIALNFSTLVSGGIPVAQALEITGQVVGNPVYKGIILETKEGVKKGQKISSVLERYPKYISPLFFQMIVVGEKTGTLDSSLVNVISFYEEETDRALESFAKLLEPIMIIILGLLVGGLIAAVLLPIYSGLGTTSGG
ncbi:MAG: type II secretion system F family protein [Candidatus Nealsonbacteria bacterium]|nr:type II secretion system F family protein [Candidatus Nealsonbacteria bacterium]